MVSDNFVFVFEFEVKMEGKKIAIILVGAPGSGKGTQGEILEKNTGFKRYVMSSLIREYLKEGSELYDKMNNGILLDDLDVFKIFRSGFKLEDKVIIDGIPRSFDQAYWLYGFLNEHGYDVEVLYFKVDEEKLLERILKRGRADDNVEVFKNRLAIFDEARDVVLDVFRKEIVEVDGDRDIDSISKDVLVKLKERGI